MAGASGSPVTCPTFFDNDPIVDNPMFEGYNLETKLEQFYNTVKIEANAHRHGHVMLTMGGDFQYSDANMWFTQLDKLITAVNARTDSTNVTVFYSTPGCYVNALNEAQPHLPTKTDDFFPYASGNHSYWTGYFTSKPGLKGLIRASSSLLQLTRQFCALALLSEEACSKLDVQEHAQALCTHHDAVTGTSKENVTQDYTRRLLKGWRHAENALNAAFWRLASKNNSTLPPPQQPPFLRFCWRANESDCEATKSMQNFSLVLFNGDSRELETLIRVPYHWRNARVFDFDQKELKSELLKTFLRGSAQPLGVSAAPYELAFRARIPPLGFRTYFVFGSDEKRKKKSNDYRKRVRKFKNMLNGGDGVMPQANTISNGFFRLTFDTDGLLSSVTDFRRNRTHRVKQQFLYYTGMPLGHMQASGAYILRPNVTAPRSFAGQVQLQLVNNSLVQEVRQVVAPWISQTIRLVPGKPYIEFDFTIGPLPKNKSALETTEVVTRYTLDGMNSNGTFWTDANGRQMLKRRRNDSAAFYEGTEPVAANYYPVNSRILIEDQSDRMVVLTDRSQGGTSLSDGQLELMLHRRAFWDDNFGVEEPLDEPGEDGRGLIIRGRHWLLLGDPSSADHRPLGLEMFRTGVPHMLAFAPFNSGAIADFTAKFRTEFSGLSSPMPSNVHILTLRPLDGDNNVLLRLEHFYQQTELAEDGHSATGRQGAEPSEVDIQKLFSPFDVLSGDELGLAANVPVKRSGGPRRGPGGLIVQLGPMQIRTFRLRIAGRQRDQ